LEKRSRRKVWKDFVRKYGFYETLNWFEPYPYTDLYKNKAKYYRRVHKLETKKLLKEY